VHSVHSLNDKTFFIEKKQYEYCIADSVHVMTRPPSIEKNLGCL
jgi:hypothetical protein